MTWNLLPAVAIFLALGLALQGAVGFGCGLFAVPMMLWSGVPLPVAIAVVLAGVFWQTAWNTWQYREHVPWQLTWKMLALRAIGMPVGVWLLGLLAEQSQSRVKVIVGLILLAVLAVQWGLKVRPSQHVTPGWTALAGVTSGFMAGLLGMGGPPVVLWVMAHDWRGKRARAFLWATFLQLMPLQITLVLWKFGQPVAEGLAVGAAMLPVSIAASTVGLKLGERLSRQHLRLAAYSLLVAVALSMMAG